MSEFYGSALANLTALSIKNSDQDKALHFTLLITLKAFITESCGVVLRTGSVNESSKVKFLFESESY